MGTAQVIPLDAHTGQMRERWSRTHYTLIFLFGIFLLIVFDLADGVNLMLFRIDHAAMR